MKRKRYSNELKSKAAIAAIKGHQTANKMVSEIRIHVSQVHRWKKEAFEALPSVFGDDKAKDAKATEIDKDSFLWFSADAESCETAGL